MTSFKAAVIAAAVIAIPALAAPPPGADPDSPAAEWYHSLLTPKEGWLCCSVADCRPVKWRTRDGHYEAWVDSVTFSSDAPDAWVAVPDDAVIHRHDNPTGDAVLCWYRASVRCFVPGVEA